MVRYGAEESVNCVYVRSVFFQERQSEQGQELSKNMDPTPTSPLWRAKARLPHMTTFTASTRLFQSVSFNEDAIGLALEKMFIPMNLKETRKKACMNERVIAIMEVWKIPIIRGAAGSSQGLRCILSWKGRNNCHSQNHVGEGKFFIQ